MSARIDPWRIARIVGMLLVVWVIFAFFNASEFYRRAISTGYPHELWINGLRFQLQSSLLWAAFTPIVILIAERVPVRKPHRLRNALLLAPIIVVLAVIRAAAGGAITQWADNFPVTLDFMLLSVAIRVHRNVFLIVVIVGITNFVLAQRSAAARERAAFALKAAVADAELQRLRASVQPPYVFSTIDAIASSVTSRPAVADRMLVDVSELLRATQEAAGREQSTLSEELELMDRYFDVERTRTGGAFAVRVLVDEELLAARVPPLILRPLVEAACLEARGGGTQAIEIIGRGEDDRLILQVRRDAAAMEVEHRLELPKEEVQAL